MAVAMLERLEQLRERHEELTRLASDPEVIANAHRYRGVLRELGPLSKLVAIYRDYQEVCRRRAEAAEMARSEGERELRELAEAEARELQGRERALLDELVDRLAEEEEGFAGRSVILEIRAGTGGEEAALFAADLLRMYTKYAEGQGWRVEVLDSSPTSLGGFREVVLSVGGGEAWRKLRFESGGHRVQRVPETDTQGRIHTSACTVAVLPEPEEVEIEIRPEDLEMQACRAGGPGGQNVNKTSSAVRLTHKPTGMTVRCQEESSQHKNRVRAEKILRARLFEMLTGQRKRERDRTRKSQIGSGDRNERIRTYNFPQNRVSDHRVDLDLYDLEKVILGGLEPVVQRLLEADRARILGGG